MYNMLWPQIWAENDSREIYKLKVNKASILKSKILIMQNTDSKQIGKY